jgi:bidirectional [NiFe] hydrogenase diaphorase subunit
MTATTTEHPSGDTRFELLDKKLKRVRFQQDQLIEILHDAQSVFGYLSSDVLVYVARQLGLPPSRVFGVATFYHLFKLEPQGEHSCTVCMGTACYVKGADEIVAKVAGAYGIADGETTEDGQFTLSSARCLGSCGLAPVVLMDGEVLSHQSAESTLEAVGGILGGER